MKKKVVKIGFDLDGVLLYNPVRIFRFFITDFYKKIKNKILKKNEEITFYIPQKSLEKFIWLILHKTSFMINPGYENIIKLTENKNVKLYLITGRFSFLKKDLDAWLKKIRAKKIFKEIYYNKNDEQPHQFKIKMIKKLNLDFYVEDNWDIVKKLIFCKKTKILWLTNIIDNKINYPLKFKNLKEIYLFLTNVFQNNPSAF